MTRLFILLLACVIGLTACGGSGGSNGSGGNSSSGNDGTDGGDGNDGDDGDGNDGDGGGDTTPPLPYNYADETDAATEFMRIGDEFSRLAIAIPNAPAFVVSGAPGPVSTPVRYDGAMRVFMGTSFPTISATIVGDAALDIDMSAQTVDGVASNFMGEVPNPDGGQFLVRYNGDVLLSTSDDAAQAGFGQSVLIDVDGSLNDGIHNFTIDGSLEGGFRGADGALLYAKGTQQIGDLTPLDALENGEIGVTIQTNRSSYATINLYLERDTGTP